jgi:hypothetical protein
MNAPTTPPPSFDHASSALRRRRDELAEQVAELHWDLGGLTYEMAIRDHFRLDLLVRRAATLQERDAELAEVERLLRLEDSASAGACPACAAPHSRGALFCWQCGTTLMQRSPSTAVSAAADGARQEIPLGGASHGDAPRDDFGRAAREQDTLVMNPVTSSEE